MKSLNDKIYADKFIRCRCGFLIGETRLDGQCLILESGLIVFNYISVQCPQGHNLSWLAPLLPNEKINFDSEFPDSRQLADKAKAVRDVALAKQFGYTAKDNNADYQFENQTAAT